MAGGQEEPGEDAGKMTPFDSRGAEEAAYHHRTISGKACSEFVEGRAVRERQSRCPL